MLRLILLLVIAALLLLGWGYRLAVSEPALRQEEVLLPDLPSGEAIRLVLISDIHSGGPDMPPERLARIVKRINSLSPDLVLIAGDFVSDKHLATRRYTMTEAIKPLAKLRARFGSFAVLGNHDHWNDPAGARAALKNAKVTLLENAAARAGPLVLGGLGDDYTGRDDLPGTLKWMRNLGGVPLLLSHSPDPFPDVPQDVRLMLAGHTHCGQVRFPLIGAPRTYSRFGQRYACGRVDENGKTLIVTAGLGTSKLPIRLGAVPDIWLVRVVSR